MAGVPLDLPVLSPRRLLSSAVILLMWCAVRVTTQVTNNCSKDDPLLGSVAGGTAAGGLLLALLTFLLGMLAGAAAHHFWAANHAHKEEEEEHTYLPMSSTATTPQATWGDLGGDAERYHAPNLEEGVASHPIEIPLNSAHHTHMGDHSKSHQGLNEDALTSAHHDVVEGQLYDTIPEPAGGDNAHFVPIKKENYENVSSKKLKMRPQIHAHSCDNLFGSGAFSAPLHMTRSVENLDLVGGRGQERELDEKGRGHFGEESGRVQGEEQMYEDVGDVSGLLAGGGVQPGATTNYPAPSLPTRLQGFKYDYVTTGRGWRQSQDALNRVATKEERLVCSTEVSIDGGKKSTNVGRKSRAPKGVSKPHPPQTEWNSVPRTTAKPQIIGTKPRLPGLSNHGYDNEDDDSYVITEANTNTRKNRTPRGETTPLSPMEGIQRDVTPRQRPLTPREGKGGKVLTPREGPLTPREGPLTPREGPLTPREGKRKSLPLPPRNKIMTSREGPLTPREGKSESRTALLPSKETGRSEI